MQNRKRARSRVVTEISADKGDRFLRELTELVGGIDGWAATYLKGEMLSKYMDDSAYPPEVRRRAAIDKWLATERRNAVTNVRLQIALTHDFTFGWISWEQLRGDVRRLIGKILGPLEYPSIVQDGVHTGGASTRVRRSPIAAAKKLTDGAHCSASAMRHWAAAYEGTRLESKPLQQRESSELFTVPKKSEIDRVACKEPEVNMLLQRSVGNHIRRRLKVFGVDLNDQTVNQELARVAVGQKLATIDLSSASDSITKQVVVELLPAEWWALLDDLRVHSTTVDGEHHDLEMFSSMGNGFTFELESLIFYAVTRVVCWRSGKRGRVSVYGDDIICPTGIVPRLRRVFSFLGFVMNQGKTHDRGPFRESCGSHWWHGIDVKPFYIRRAVRELPDLINHLNHLLEWDGRGWGFFTTREAYEFWLRWSKAVPSFLWGGIDPQDPSALVTGHTPRKRLQQGKRELRRPEAEALDLWFLAREQADKGKTPQGVMLPPRMWTPKMELRSLRQWALRWEDPALAIDPRLETGKWFASPVKSRGARTTWCPGAAFAGPGLG